MENESQLPQTSQTEQELLPVKQKIFSSLKFVGIAILIVVYVFGCVYIINRFFTGQTKTQSINQTMKSDSSVPSAYPTPVCPDNTTFNNISDAMSYSTQVCAMYFSNEQDWEASSSGREQQYKVIDEIKAPSALPDAVVNMKNLKVLVANSYNVNVLPIGIGNLKKLVDVSLYNNMIDTFPVEITSLKNLTSLNFSRNRITVIPPEIGQLTNLTSLMLYGNRIETLPKEMGNLSNLTILQLSENKLSVLPDSFAQLTHLTDLYLEENQFNDNEKAKIQKMLPKTNIHF
jgi:Leucine-rich repeat (LRR) protein